MKKAITALIAIMILFFNISLVTAQNMPVYARNDHGQQITLYQAKTRHNRQYLLDNITPGKSYILIEYRRNIFNTEDNSIIYIRETK